MISSTALDLPGQYFAGGEDDGGSELRFEDREDGSLQ
jgi:hypothetical protein